MSIHFSLAIVKPYKLVHQIQASSDFNQLLLSNYMEHSNGVSMKAYAQKEMDILCKATYGVEDFHIKLDAYVDYLREIIE